MSAHLRSTSLRVRAARITVAGAAALASVLTIAPAAVADDALPADTTGPADGTTSEPSVPEEEPTTPVEETSGTTEESPGTTEESPGTTGTPQPGPSQKSQVSAKAADVAAEEVEPNFGSQKFRVRHGDRDRHGDDRSAGGGRRATGHRWW